MKPKEIVTLIVALVVLVVSVYFGYNLMFPNQNANQAEVVEAEKVNVVPKDIDEKTYQSVEVLSDYGKPNLDGLGKPNLFGN